MKNGIDDLILDYCNNITNLSGGLDPEGTCILVQAR